MESFGLVHLSLLATPLSPSPADPDATIRVQPQQSNTTGQSSISNGLESDPGKYDGVPARFPQQEDTQNPSSQCDTQPPASEISHPCNSYLKFTQPSFPVDDRNGFSITARLQGTFTLAEDPGDDGIQLATKLTCYRRNIFRVAGQVIIQDAECTRWKYPGHVQIKEIKAQLSALESRDNSPVKLLTLASASQADGESTTGRHPKAIPLNITPYERHGSGPYHIPVSWERLQFRSATANNGRKRKELQQHYELVIKVVAALEDGTEDFVLCEARSRPLTVRGRSPKNFSERNDIPLVDDTRRFTAYKESPIIQLDALSTTEMPPVESQTPLRETSMARAPSRSGSINSQMADFYLGDMMLSPNMWNWIDFTQTEQNMSPSRADIPLIHHASPLMPTSLESTGLTPGATPVGHQRWSAQRGRAIGADREPPSFTPSSSSQPVPEDSDDEADKYYEYFPLGLAGWQPPVDSVYWPHPLHHKKKAAESVTHRPKRYFSQTQM